MGEEEGTSAHCILGSGDHFSKASISYSKRGKDQVQGNQEVPGQTSIVGRGIVHYVQLYIVIIRPRVPVAQSLPAVSGYCRQRCLWQANSYVDQ